MKQSTKLLSLVLALVMAFSCVTVIGNAALDKSQVKWDIIDDATLTPEQVADLALDLVDNDLLAGMEAVDLSILGELRLDKIDYILEDICSLRDSLAWSIGSGLLKNLGAMDFDPLLQSGEFGLLSSHTAYQRSHGDLAVIGALLEFIGNNNNSEILSRIAYGMGDSGTLNSNGDLTNTAQLNLGLISSFLDLGDFGDVLNDLPGYLKKMVFDMLVFGSYGYDKDSEELGGALPSEMDTLDEIARNAIYNLLVNPQEYDYEGEGTSETKVWDMGTKLLPGFASHSASEVDPVNLSIFQILDNVAQVAIDDIGVPALNHNLKKNLMEAVEVEFNEIDVTSLPADAAAAFETSKDESSKSYVTYLAYDKLAKSGNTWYYTTLETEDDIDPTTGEPKLDEDGNVMTVRTRKYFKANFAVANKFASLINWDWNFVKSTATPAEGDTQLVYADIISDGSIASGINDLIGIVYEAGLTDAAKADFEAVTGDGWLEGNENINDNVVRITKYLLSNFGDMMFGSDSAYAEYTYEDLEALSIVEMVAMIGPSFFEDAMPQILLPKNADGTYAFHEGVQLFEFAAIVLRELITGIAPEVNYDHLIFENGDVTSADDRLFAEHSADEWRTIILNLGTDLALVYLEQITNFKDYLTANYGESFKLEEWVGTGALDNSDNHWQTSLNAAIDWACKYVDTITTGNISDWSAANSTGSILAGFDPVSVSAYSDPIDKLSYILNTLLPLGFVNGYSSADFDLDLNLVVDGIMTLLSDFDLNTIINLFGRNADSSYNAFDDVSVSTAVLRLANGILKLVFRTDILQLDGSSTQSIDAILTQPNLKKTVAYLLRSLYANKDLILNAGLPVLGKLIKGWGTEQAFNEPQVGLSKSIDLTNGATSEAVTVQVRNAANGVWRHYRDAAGNEYTDNQYQIQLTGVSAYDGITNTKSSTVTPTLVTTTNINYGQVGTFTYTAANVPTSGDLVRFEVTYKVIDEDGQYMGDIYTTKCYAYLNYNGSNEGQAVTNDSELIHTAIYTPQYVALSTALDEIPELSCSYFGRDYKFCTKAQTGEVKNTSGTVDGLTFGSLSQSFANNDKGRYLNDVKNFKTYTQKFVNEDGEETSDSYSVAGSVDAAAWKAANKTSGSKTNFNITLTDKDGSESKTFSIIYYDDIALNKLSSLAGNEMEAARDFSEYNTTGTAYADKILTTVNSTDEEGEKVYKESAFSTLAWVDDDDNVYAESAVSDIDVEYDEDGTTVVAKSGTATNAAGDKVAVKLVTAIDCAAAYNAYVAAFEPGVRGGMQAFNDNSVYNFDALYEALYVAVNDFGYCRKTAEQLAAEGGNTSGAETVLATLKTTLESVEEQYITDYNYTDYKMHRLNRFNDARDDAHSLLQLQDDASPATVAEIDEYFDYNWMEENDFRALVKGDAKEAMLLALLEKFDDEEIKAKAEWLADRKVAYQTLDTLDVEMTINLLERTSSRLLTRDRGLITKQLEDEIASANNMIGTDASRYTEKSWAHYSEALQFANDVLAENGVVKSQKHIFDAKYRLLLARKALVLDGEEADYTELEALIGQAQYALEHTSLYNNTNKEFGQVLAELGYNEIDDVQLFPGSALLVLEKGYHVDDQDKVDSAADALKEALARLEFKNTKITGNGVSVNESVLVEGDEEKDIDEVVATTANIGEGLDADAVKALFQVSADNATVGADQITVSNDLYYTIDTDLEGFAGTNAVVTFYTVVADGVKIPVATVKLIVNGDINGDGTVDVQDGAYAALVASGRGELEGCFLLAGDLANTDRDVTADDYGAIVNLVVD